MASDDPRARWLALFAQTAASDTLTAGFADLAERYAEKHRHYHTLDHITACLSALDGVRDSPVDRFSIAAALWFHDVIYNPRSDDNEAASARYARRFLSTLDLDAATITRIEQFIRLTKHPSTPVTEDEKLLIDIDLGILGASPTEFDRYDRQIRSEYAFVPGFLYKRRRAAVLKGFLDRDRIYQTRWFLEQREDRARSNLHRALHALGRA